MKTDSIYQLEWTNNVRTIGRVFVYNDVLWLSYSGCGIEFVCNGGFCATLIADDMIHAADAEIHYARYAVLMDGVQIRGGRLAESESVIEAEAEGEHTFRIIKLSESADSSLGIREISGLAAASPNDAEFDFRPSESPELKIEIIGDSITCGYGVEGSLAETYTTATENVSEAWAYKTAGRLGADYSIVSRSGAGIISGYTGDGIKNTENLLPEVYDKMGCSLSTLDGKVFPADFEYDFTYEPDLIIVNLGTNDISYCMPYDEKGQLRISGEEAVERRRDFHVHYKEFISHVRERNPFSKIMCILGVMGTVLNDEVEMVVSELNAAGDSRIFSMSLAEQDAAHDGYGTDYHPSKVTQNKLTDAVVGRIKEII